MADLIERQAATDALDKIFPVDPMRNDFTQGIACGAALAKTYVGQLPSAQPEIIRCKDCKNYYFADNRVPSEQSWVCDAWGVDQTAYMGYCFKAERRTDE